MLNEEYKCFICYKVLSRKHGLIYHLLSEKRKTTDTALLKAINKELNTLQPPKKVSFHCNFCKKPLKNKYSVERHQLKCLMKDNPVESDDDDDLSAPEALKEHEQLESIARPLTLTQQFGKQQFQLNQKISQKYSQNKVKVLLAEDYLPILEEKLGSKEAVYNYLKSCMYRKQAGDLDIFNKIHMEGRSPNYYPVKCLDRKTLRFAYVNKEGRLVEGTNFALKYLSGNIQDCYIQIQNEAILNHCKKGESGHDFLFNQHDVGGWQEHLVEYRDNKYQLELLKGLAAMLYDEIQEYSQGGGLYIDIGLNYQFAPDELEFPVQKNTPTTKVI